MATPPLSPHVAIVDDKGRPTPAFLQWWQQQRDQNSNIVPLGTGGEVSAVIDKIGGVQGAVLYRDSANWNTLAPGTAGRFLKSMGAANNPIWDIAGGGAATVRTETASTSLVLGDANNIVVMNAGAANTLVVPANATAAFPIGTAISVIQLGAGLTSVVSAAGVTINGVTEGSGAMPGQYSTATLVNIATNVWNLVSRAPLVQAAVPKQADFTITGAAAGTLLSDEIDHFYMAYDTDDANPGAVVAKKSINLSGNKSLIWRMGYAFPNSNYHASRGSIYRADGYRLDFGAVYDAGLKFAITEFDAANSYVAHRYGPDATHYGKEWFKVTRTDSSGALEFFVSSDGAAWTSLLTWTWTGTDFGLRVSYGPTAVVGQLVEARLYSLV